jgi:hypothetical protein
MVQSPTEAEPIEERLKALEVRRVRDSMRVQLEAQDLIARRELELTEKRQKVMENLAVEQQRKQKQKEEEMLMLERTLAASTNKRQEVLKIFEAKQAFLNNALADQARSPSYSPRGARIISPSTPLSMRHAKLPASLSFSNGANYGRASPNGIRPGSFITSPTKVISEKIAKVDEVVPWQVNQTEATSPRQTLTIDTSRHQKKSVHAAQEHVIVDAFAKSNSNRDR